ncbi:MAG: peroxiredoxin family protein [Ectobacillus sp.]
MLRKGIVIIVLLTMVGYATYHQFWKEKQKGAVKQTAQEVFANKGLQIGKEAPDFELQTVDGKQVKLSDFKGKKVIVNFWATWCPPCRKEIPEMQAFYNKYEKDTVILAVNYTASERTGGREKVQSFIQENGITFPVLLDASSTVSNMYKVITLPTSYFVDKKGIIRHKYIGPMTVEYMEKTVQAFK